MRIHDSPPPSIWHTLEALPRSTSATEVQGLFKRQFGALAADKHRFHTVMRGSFGDGYDVRKAERYRQRALAGDFAWLPRVGWVDPEILEGARGAWYPEFGTVFLDRTLLRSLALAATTFVEEAGHVLESHLTLVDSPDNRGPLFRRLLGGECLA